MSLINQSHIYRTYFIPQELPAQPSSSESSADRYSGPLPTISFTEPTGVEGSLFNQATWRQSPRNRSLPSHPLPHVTGPGATTTSTGTTSGEGSLLGTRRATATRTVSGPAVTVDADTPNLSQASPIYRAWLPHPPITTAAPATSDSSSDVTHFYGRNGHHVMEVVFSGAATAGSQQPGRSAAQAVFTVQPPRPSQSSKQGKSTKTNLPEVKD